MMTLGSLFDGSGGFPLAGIYAGMTPLWASEVEPYPIAVTRACLPGMKHLGDVSKVSGAEVVPVDVITFGSPCFPAGTLVLTDHGYLEIERIRPGMKVLTHKGRWRKVTAAGAKIGKTVIVKGNHYGLECTPNHPIYSAEMRRYYPSVAGKRQNIRLISSEKNWTPAEQMQGKLWAVPHTFEPLSIPRPTPMGDHRLKEMPPFDENFFYLVGRWIGDGWVRGGQRPDRPDGQTFGTIIICDGYAGEKKLRAAVESVVDNYSVERCRTTVNYKFTSRLFADWLITHFGSGAANKKIPAWAYSMPAEWRSAMLQGILDTDGYKFTETTRRITTISKKLAHGIRLLGETLGFSTTVFYTITADTRMIEGRIVNQRDYYTVQLTASKNRSRLSDELHSWYHVRNVYATGEQKTVYNLTVEEDNSYIADDVVVHNCQDMSIAGKRAGMQHAAKGDEETTRSGMFYEAIRIIREMREATHGEYPKYAVWENVPGAFSSNKGEDFRSVLEEFVSVAGGEAVSVPLPEKGKWLPAGEIVGDGFSVAWRVLDAQYWGVPQRRKRIYLVADFTGECAGKILFERDGLSGDSQPSQTAREGTADDAERSIGGSDRVECLNPWDCQSKRQYAIDGVYRTLDAGQASGGQAHGVVYEPKPAMEENWAASDVKNALRANASKSSCAVACDARGNGDGKAVPTLTGDHQNRVTDYTSICVEGDGMAHAGIGIDISPTLKARHTNTTLADKPPRKYIVRRLTPLECCRLQGFPDGWADIDCKDDFTDEELDFWRSVRSTHAAINGKHKQTKEYTKAQMLKWYNGLQTDSATYRMWGNGIALPCARFVLEGIAEKLNAEGGSEQ